eukprot:PhM_4_TR16463/c0_g1_i1/m.65100
MFRTVILVTLVIVGACAQTPAPTGNDTLPHACWKQTQTRGAGVVPSSCPSGYDKSGALCYPDCKDGYTGVGPVCWENCPAGYHDDGATCRIPLKVISADTSKCPWYDKCGLSHNCSTCPEGYTNDGCTCRIPLKIIAKKSYGRTAGIPMVCENGLEMSGALCYPPCKGDLVGHGPVCWQQCPQMYNVSCGWLCGSGNFSCSNQVKEFITDALQEVVACMQGATPDCIMGVAKLAKTFALDGLCPAVAVDLSKIGFW